MQRRGEGYIGKTAPWFILPIMLFSLCRARGVRRKAAACRARGVYRAVKMALAYLSEISVSALMFDYI